MDNLSDPPDNFVTIKCSLDNIIRSNQFKIDLFDVVMRVHQIIIHSYMFLRLWILKKYATDNIPTITEATIRLVYRLFMIDSKKGRPVENSLFTELIEFYKTEYKSLFDGVKIDGLHLSHTLNASAANMLTAIENNIKCNFFDYVKRFVNSYFKKDHDDILSKIDDKKEKALVQKRLRSELYAVKNDLFNGTKNCDAKYHEWLGTYREKILPSTYQISYYYDIKCEPQKYLKYMIYMVSELEKLEVKSFQFFPLRTNIVPKYITIETSVLEELFAEDLKGIDDDDTNIVYEKWNQIFNLNLKCFKRKNYQFNYTLLTDGFSVSIQMIHDKHLIVSNLKKQRITEGKVRTNGKSKEERKIIKEQLAAERKIIKEQFAIERKKLSDQQKAEFEKLPKEEQQKIRKERKQLKDSKKKPRIKYLEDLNDTELELLKNSKKVYIDPGKKTLLHMMSDDNEVLRYTNKQRVKEVRRLKYQKTLETYKETNGIKTEEDKLSKYNSKTVDITKFKEYITMKNKVNRILLKKYEADIFRKQNWYRYINGQRSDANLINRIKATYGEDIIILYGDWNVGKQMKNFISTPNTRLFRLLNKYFTVLLFDEFRTSCLYYQTRKKCNNLILPDKKGTLRELHSVLTFQMKNKQNGCINRDRNAINAFKEITHYYIEHKERPLEYRRTYDLEKGVEIIKDSNPKKLKKKTQQKSTEKTTKDIKKHKKSKRGQIESSRKGQLQAVRIKGPKKGHT
jgi:hypothetical protein